MQSEGSEIRDIAVKKSPKLRDVGSRIRQILDSMSWDAQLDRLEADFTAGLEDTWVSELRAKLADAFAVATVDSGLQAPLWSAMLRDAADPDAKVLAKWLAEGFPLGIQRSHREHWQSFQRRLKIQRRLRLADSKECCRVMQTVPL